MLTLLFALHAMTAAPPSDPFAFFRPWVTISADDRQQLARGEPIAHTLPDSGREVAVVAVIPVSIDGDRLVAWIRRIDELKKSPYVLAIRRLSDPPRLEDIDEDLLDERELSDIRDCQPGACGLKLSAPEMNALQHAAEGAGDRWQRALQIEFRRTVLGRLQAYLASRAAAMYEDHPSPIRPDRELATLVDHTGFLAERLPAFAAYLRSAPRPPYAGAESFIYWSKERVAGKAVVSATDVSILRGGGGLLPDALITGRQIFATHYMNASLGITALVRGEPGRPNYLVYINRTQLDMLQGLLGAFVRPLVQHRLNAEAATVLQGLKRRVESGEPPHGGATLMAFENRAEVGRLLAGRLQR